MNKRHIIIGTVENYNAQINELYEKRNNLINTSGDISNHIRSPMSGYFSSYTDGYESMLSPSTIEVLSIDDFYHIFNNPVKDYDSLNNGKIMPNYEWYYAAVIIADEIKDIKLGQPLFLRFPLAYNNKIPCTVTEIYEKENNMCVIVLKSTHKVNDLLMLRVQTAEIIKKEYRGIRVSKLALRQENGVLGVFTNTGSKVRFKKIEYIYEKDNYVVVIDKPDEPNYLRLYDEIIIGGKDLKDGMIMN